MSEFSKRVLKPVLIPILAALFIAVMVLAFSRVLLAVPEIGSTSIALLMASVVLLICGVIAAAGRLVAAQRVILGLATVGLLAGGGAAASIGIREIEKHAEEIEISAEALKFNTDTLQFPVEQEVALKFHNNDAGVPHNVTIARDAAYTDIIVQKPPFNGVASTTYDVEPLPEGVYPFRCDVHPTTMVGNVLVGEAEAPAGGEASPSPSTPAPSPTTSPTVLASETPGAGQASTTADISADQLKFSTDELQLKAASAVVITFENKEAVPHNIAIHKNPDFTDPAIFREDPVTGPVTVEYEFNSPEAGTYYFRCEVHPDMKGTVLFPVSSAVRAITWNLNSVKTRLPRLLALLERERPDIVLLQEVKATDEAFPRLELSAAGYEALVHGQQPYNGVAILAKEPTKEIARTFPGNPLPDDARMIAARVGDVSVVSVYVVNGRMVGDPMYDAKLAWLASFRAWLTDTFDPSEPLIVAGDFNVCPDERDLWDPAAWEGHCHFTLPEREQVAALQTWGLVDLFRIHTQEAGHFSWWDYRAGAFHKREGLRIDLMLATEPLASRCTEVRIDRNERRPTAGEGAPSDHAPVIATFAEA